MARCRYTAITSSQACLRASRHRRPNSCYHTVARAVVVRDCGRHDRPIGTVLDCDRVQHNYRYVCNRTLKCAIALAAHADQTSRLIEVAEQIAPE